MSNIKWQGTFHKRASHAFINNKVAGEASLCGRETLHNGETHQKPQGNACGACVNKLKKITEAEVNA